MVQRDEAAQETSTALATRTSFDVSTLREMKSLDDALRVLNDAGITIKDASEVLGDGFELLDDDEKEQLVGVGLVIIEGNQSDGDFGRFTSLRMMTRDGRKVIVNDGSTGIHAQVTDYLTKNDTISGLHMPNGLRSSHYTFCDACKNKDKQGASACTACGNSPMKPAATYYLDTTK